MAIDLPGSWWATSEPEAQTMIVSLRRIIRRIATVLTLGVIPPEFPEIERHKPIARNLAKAVEVSRATGNYPRDIITGGWPPRHPRRRPETERPR